MDHTLKEFQYSMPVGRIEFLYLYPLSFKEFLNALSQNKFIEYIQNYKINTQHSKLIHKKILEYVRFYIFIGGMPEAVKTYIKDDSLVEVQRVHNNILTALQYDFAKYGTRKQQDYLINVLHYCSKNVGNKVKFSKVNSDVRSSELKDAFNKLELSRIIHLVRHTNISNIPIIANLPYKKYKPLFLDIGLINFLGGMELINIEDILTANEGALAEQFIGQELLTLADSFMDQKLFYWAREEKNSNAEIDYIYQFKKRIFPIEVKAGKTGTLKSLQVYLLEKRIKFGIRFNTDQLNYHIAETRVQIKKEKRELQYQLLSLPIYMCFHLPDILDEIL